MMSTRTRRARIASWGAFLALLLTVGTGFNPGSLKRGGCHPSPELLDQLREWEGIVQAFGGSTAVPRATVRLDDRTTLADPSGHFLFRDVPFGSHELAITADGFAPFEDVIVLEQGAVMPIFKLRPLAEPLVTVPLMDVSTYQNADLVSDFSDATILNFDSARATLNGQAFAQAFIDYSLAALPPGARVTQATLFGTFLFGDGLGPGGTGGGGGGGDSARRLTPSSAQDDAIVLEAYAVLDAWDQHEIRYLNQPRNLLETPVAVGVVPANSANASSQSFTIDLTRFVNDVRSGRLLAHGIVLTTRDDVQTGAVSIPGAVASSEYSPPEQALKLVVRYTTAAGRPAEIVLR